MRFDPPLRILAAATEIPTTHETAAGAVARGRATSQDVAELGVDSLPVEAERAAPELAVAAARTVLARARRSARDVDLVAHAWTHFQGHPFWSPAHYVAARSGANAAYCVGVQQMCNGGVAALELAAGRMAADPAVRTALVTTADRFDDAGFDRWSGDYGVAYGDGATACLIERREPGATGPDDVPLVHAVASASLPELEGLHRDDAGFRTHPHGTGRVDVRGTKRSYLRRHGSDTLKRRFADALRTVVPAALADAGIAAQEVGTVVVPRVGAGVIADMYAPALAEVLPCELEHHVRTTGHLGAGDLVANLLEATDRPEAPGRYRAYVTAGAGFTLSVTVVEHPAHEAGRVAPPIDRPTHDDGAHPGAPGEEAA